ncbi:DUF6879 family protein [Streptomyces tsukubensis]|uniref:DUF6879 domain-containing protein n=1 Tax=Streptomyces tsukubensis TaxID=83656 RepID=A0A1V4AE03_9ACTN|nr:DUF6879 family protein [Streptomyces tsukubensis]OON81795.1 hypothetical protein B1H18_06710 [Streptomyces tsukubensis]QFR96584.1 hypothetical protein GBW32_30575 [Streptomyces tsukubensis]
MNISTDEFGKLFTTFEREAFRLEALDDYSSSSDPEMIRAFLAGEPQPSEYNQQWVDDVRRSTDAGKRMYRVHVVSRPLTSYLRFELGWGYIKSQAVGEEFFILDTTEQENPVSGIPDFWMFDESRVVSMNYGEKGKFLGAELEPETTEWVKVRDTALRHAAPFSEWWERHGQE